MNAVVDSGPHTLSGKGLIQMEIIILNLESTLELKNRPNQSAQSSVVFPFYLRSNSRKKD